MDFFTYLSGDYKPLSFDTRSILVMNSKGGSGKTTLATNLASYYATKKFPVVLVDFDPQGSSMAWLEARAEGRPPIRGLAAWREGLRVPKPTRVAILDVPSGLHHRQLTKVLKHAHTVIIPVLPSPIDIRAAGDFIDELLQAHDRAGLRSKLAVVANRVRENTHAYEHLEAFLSGLTLPFITTLREHSNYLSAAERGLGLFEMAPSAVETDLKQWKPLLTWLHSRRSLPTAR